MHKRLNRLPFVINMVFDVLELIVRRIMLLILAALGAYYLLLKVP